MITEKAKTIDAHVWSIKDYIEQDYTMMISYYQRGYRWNKKQIETLLEDIKNAQSEDRAYLIGPINLLHSDQSTKIMEVVDGQQRLTTLHLLIHDIARKLAELKRIGYEGLEEAQQQRANELEQFLDAHVFNSNKGSNLTHKRETERSALKEYNKQVRINYQKSWSDAKANQREISVLDKNAKAPLPTALKEIKKFMDSELDSSEIVGFAYHLFTKTKVVAITVPDDISALQLFETLNDRGLRLRKIDLIRNAVFMNMHEEDTHSCLELFDDVENFIKGGLVQKKSESAIDDHMTALFTQFFECHIEGNRIEEEMLFVKLKSHFGRLQSAGDGKDPKKAIFELVKRILSITTTVEDYWISTDPTVKFWDTFCYNHHPRIRHRMIKRFSVEKYAIQ